MLLQPASLPAVLWALLHFRCRYLHAYLTELSLTLLDICDDILLFFFFQWTYYVGGLISAPQISVALDKHKLSYTDHPCCPLGKNVETVTTSTTPNQVLIAFRQHHINHPVEMRVRTL